MMNPLEAYLVSAKTILSVCQNVCTLDLVGPIKEDVAYVHLVEQPFELTEDVEYYTKVVTAHRLSQYQNKIHAVRLEEDIETWLDILVAQDRIERERISI